jgi:gamma-glutamylputrescine oxidase
MHARSWYAATAHPVPPRPALAGRVDADVCVVGGGIAGCSTALHLAERGYRVVLLEERVVGGAASGRNGGQLLAGYGCGQGRLARLLGDADAERLWHWSVEGLALARELIARHQIDCDWRPGHLQLALKPRHEDEIAAELEQLARYGYAEARFVPRAEARELVRSPRYLAGLHDSAAGHVHPLNYTLGLAAAAERAGARLYEGTRALRIVDGEPSVVVTTAGEVRARYVALCGNAHLGATAPAIRPRIMPVGTYVVATEPLGAERAAALIAGDLAVTDMNWVLDYYRLSRDHRLLFGGKVSYSGYDPDGVTAGMRRRIEHVFPQLRGVRVEYAWGGLLDITFNRAPDFGRVAPNVYYVQGFSGHGVVLAGLAGRLVAEAIAGQAERFDVYARIRHVPFPGGKRLARPLLVAAMAWYRLRDAL